MMSSVNANASAAVSSLVSRQPSVHLVAHNSQISSISISKANHLPRLSNSRFRPIYCSSSSPGSGENDTKTVLDAFFLGKALGEALTERIESTVGEFLSTIGRLQAEQQKQVQEFQEDVLERAKRAKEKAARETLEEQGRLIPKPNIRNIEESNVANPNVMSSRIGPTNPASPARAVSPDSPIPDVNEDHVNAASLSSINIDE